MGHTRKVDKLAEGLASPQRSTPLRLCRVVPGLGGPWIGTHVKPEYSEMGMALRWAQEDAERRDEPTDDFVLIRCVDAGGNAGLTPGGDYLVLRRFVQDC